jgi:hypothetical protein
MQSQFEKDACRPVNIGIIKNIIVDERERERAVTPSVSKILLSASSFLN